MRLLVLGAGGQLGHDMVRVARDAGIAVRGLGRRELDLAPEPAGQAEAAPSPEPDPVAGLRDLDFDVLVNCAAYTRVDDAEADPAAAFALNARAPALLAGACAERGARLVQVSTDYVFDGEARRPYREDDAPAPLGVYGASKLTGEALARRAHPRGTLVVRTASLFGIAGARRAEAGTGGNFVETMIRRGGQTGRLRVVDDVVMSPTCTLDLARAIVHLLGDDAPAGTYHVAGLGQASWYELARAVVAGAGVDAVVEPIPSGEYPTPAVRPAFSVLDTGRALAAGCPLRPWQDALAHYLAERRATA